MRKKLIKNLVFSLVMFLVVSTLATVGDLFIRETNGKRIVLSDGSEWFVHHSSQVYSPLWILRERVTVRPAPNPQGNYGYVLMRNYGTSGILVKYLKYPMPYRNYIRHSHNPLPYLYKEKQRRDDRMWNMLSLFLLSKQLKAERRESQRGQERYKREQRKPQSKKRIANISETSTVYITVKRSYFHKKADCPFLREACKSFKVNSFGASVKRARETGCRPCPYCFWE